VFKPDDEVLVCCLSTTKHYSFEFFVCCAVSRYANALLLRRPSKTRLIWFSSLSSA